MGYIDRHPAGWQAQYDRRPHRQAAHLERVKAAYARLTLAERYALNNNTRARVHFGLFGQRIDAAQLAPLDECAYCGAAAETWDHVMPLSRGGRNDAANCVPVCNWCNRSKKDLTVEEWFGQVPEARCPTDPSHGLLIEVEGGPIRLLRCPHSDHCGRPKSHPAGGAESTRATFRLDEVEAASAVQA